MTAEKVCFSDTAQGAGELSVFATSLSETDCEKYATIQNANASATHAHKKCTGSMTETIAKKDEARALVDRTDDSDLDAIFKLQAEWDMIDRQNSQILEKALVFVQLVLKLDASIKRELKVYLGIEETPSNSKVHKFIDEIKPVAIDDMVWLTQQMLKKQSQIDDVEDHFGPNRRRTVDIGYHYTESCNLWRIRTDGLLTKAERLQRKIESNYHGSSYGDGVYTGDDSFTFSKYGNIGLMVARIRGVAVHHGYKRDVEKFADSIVVSSRSITVLKSSSLCVPIFQYPNNLIAFQNDVDFGMKIIEMYHQELQRVIDEMFNGGERTIRIRRAQFMPETFISTPTISSSSSLPMIPVRPLGMLKALSNLNASFAGRAGAEGGADGGKAISSDATSCSSVVSMASAKPTSSPAATSMSLGPIVQPQDVVTSKSGSAPPTSFIAEAGKARSGATTDCSFAMETGVKFVKASSPMAEPTSLLHTALPQETAKTTTAHVRPSSVVARDGTRASAVASITDSAAENSATLSSSSLATPASLGPNIQLQDADKSKAESALAPSLRSDARVGFASRMSSSVTKLTPLESTVETQAVGQPTSGFVPHWLLRHVPILKKSTPAGTTVQQEAKPTATAGCVLLSTSTAGAAGAAVRADTAKAPQANVQSTNISTTSNIYGELLIYEAPTNLSCPVLLLSSQMETVHSPSGNENCVICLSSLGNGGSNDAPENDQAVVAMRACKHQFHRTCITKALYHDVAKRCPYCQQKVFEPLGHMPDGTMHITSVGGNDGSLIVIHYSIMAGIQKQYHEYPGQPHGGANRTAYVPNTEDGCELLKRLKYAFMRGLTFRVGTSLTTGWLNQVTWASIHHKTSPSGGGAHGLPDPTYIVTCNGELDALGVPRATDLP